MEKGHLKLGKIGGISLQLHYSWFIIFGLLTWSLASGYFPSEYPQLRAGAHWALAGLTSALFAASILAHELGHAVIALRNRIPVRSITLFIFGGIAQIEKEPESPGAEFRIAIAGPLVSLGLGLLFGLLWMLDHRLPYLAAPSAYLARINLILAFFNLIPGFPLDGGRMLRALVWWRTKNLPHATKVSVSVGQLVALGFIGVGVFTIFTGRFFDGLWLAFIGWFLQNAAASTQAAASLQSSLQGVKVAQVMTHDCVQISGLTPLSQVVDEQVLINGNRCFMVTDNGRPEGILTVQEIAKIPQTKWRYMSSRQAMRPLKHLASVHPEADLLAALQEMEKANAAQVSVMQDDQVVGLLTRERVQHYLRTRAELGI